MLFVRQSTAVDVGIGPFLDSTDGVTPKTALTIVQADIRLKKNGGNWAQKNAAQTLTHEENGWYEVSLDATDTGTLGILMLAVTVATALPVWHDFMVLPAAVYDAIVNGTGTGVRADVQQIASGAITATAIAADAITAAKVADGTIDAATFAAGAINAAAIAADAITAAKVADGTIDAATFAAGAINAAAIAADAITAAKIADGAIDRATFAADTGLQSVRSNTAQAGAAGTITLDASASATTDFYVGLMVLLTGGTGAGQVRLITAYNSGTKVATIAPSWATNPASDSTFALLPQSQITGVQGNVTGSVASVTGAVGSVSTGGISSGSFAAGAINAAAIAADAIGASELAADAVAEIVAGVWDETRSSHVTGGTFGEAIATLLLGSPVLRTGTAQTGGAFSIKLDAGASATTDFYKDLVVVITSGTGAGQARAIESYNGSTKNASVSIAWITNPDVTSVFVLLPLAAYSKVAIANMVWDTDLAGHSDQSKFGGAVGNTFSRVDMTLSEASAVMFSALGVATATGTTAQITGGTPGVPGADDLVNGAIVVVSSGTGAGQARLITNYDLATTTLTVAPAWITTPDATSVVKILARAAESVETAAAVWDEPRSSHLTSGSFGQLGHLIVSTGTAQAGSSTSITLDAAETVIANIYDRLLVLIVAGTGKGQARLISNYGGNPGHVATIEGVWKTNPDSTSVYVLLPSGLNNTTINAEVDTAIADARLNQLLAADSDIDGAAPPTVGSVFHELMSKSTGSFSFDQTTDSLEAIRDKETDIETATTNIQSRLPAALSSGRIIAEAQVVGDKSGYSIGSGGITAASFAAGAIDNAAIAADAIGASEIAANAIGASELAQDAAQEIADEILNRDIAGGASGGTRNVRSALRALRNKVAEAAGTATVYQEDDTTAAWTASVTRTVGANPITTVDPA